MPLSTKPNDATTSAAGRDPCAMSQEPSSRRLVDFRAQGVDSRELEREILLRLAAAGVALPPASGSTGAAAVDDALERLRAAIDSLFLEISVRDEHLPIANAAWNRLKHKFHELVFLYVAEAVGQQSRVNEQVFETLKALAESVQKDATDRERRIAALEAEVRHLRGRGGQSP